MLALGASIIFYNIRFKFSKKTLTIIMSAIVFFCVSFFLFKDKIIGQLRLSHGLSARDILYDTGLSISEDYPVTGIGLGNLREVGTNYLMKNPHVSNWRKEMLIDIGIQSSHNVFIETSAEIGYIGTGILISIILTLGFKYLRKIVFNKKSVKENNIYFVCWALFMGVLARSFFESNGIINRGWITIDIYFWIIYVISNNYKNLIKNKAA